MENFLRVISKWFNRRSANNVWPYLVVDSIDNIKLKSNTFYIERRVTKDKWLHFLCPSNCNEKLSVNLMKSMSPSWELNYMNNHTLSLYPSINKTDGCKSHFFIINSQIIWAKDYRRIPRNRDSSALPQYF